MKKMVIFLFAVIIGSVDLVLGQIGCKCCTPEHRQFEFWVGHWDVFNKKGVKVGENKVLWIQDSCGIQENWVSASQTGTSYNYYNPTDSSWTQVYLDNLGTILELKGRFVDGMMVLESKPIQSSKGDFYYRNLIRWKMEGDGAVSQIWEIVTERDSVLYLAFDGIYKPKTKQADVARVTGIGGVFFKCQDPKATTAWYQKHLGLDTNPYGAMFEWYEKPDSTTKALTQWTPFRNDSKYFEGEFMINYRVENLEILVEKLKKDGVTIVDKIETYDYGKFIHILDGEGNKIQLWEAMD